VAIIKVLSGGQSGVDRAALDAAIATGVAYGGWCPHGGWAEDMVEPPGLLVCYPLLCETPTVEPEQRTRWNVSDSDAVVIINSGVPVSSLGTELGRGESVDAGKPLFEVDVFDTLAAWKISAFVASLDDVVLGVGGPRESESPGIYDLTLPILTQVFSTVQLDR
jgi:hypothetical protein